MIGSVAGYASQRGAVEDAVVALLRRRLVAEPDGYLEAVEPYQGSLDPEPEDEALNRVLNGRAPAVLVTTDDGDWNEWSRTLQRAEGLIELVLLIVSANLRSPEDSARGDGRSVDPGAYFVAEDARALLMGYPLGAKGAGRPRPTGERIVGRGEKFIIRTNYVVPVVATAYEPEVDIQRIKGRANVTGAEPANPLISGDTELDG